MIYNWRTFDDSAAKEFRKLSPSAQKLIRDYLRDRLSTLKDPKTIGKPMKYSYVGLWRYRIDKFRIICKIEDDKLVILVLKVGMRDKVYD